MFYEVIKLILINRFGDVCVGILYLQYLVRLFTGHCGWWGRDEKEGQGELGVLFVLCVQCILLLGSLPEGGPRTRCTGWSRCRTQETLEVCRKVAGWGELAKARCAKQEARNSRMEFVSGAG